MPSAAWLISASHSIPVSTAHAGSATSPGLAARTAAVGDDLAAAHRGHPRPEAVTTLTDQLAGLISAFHDATPSNTRPPRDATGANSVGAGSKRANALSQRSRGRPGRPAAYLTLHPFSRVRVLVHDGFALHETGAVTHCLDPAFPDLPCRSPTCISARWSSTSRPSAKALRC